ncbi:DUF1365 domain-containing protein [Mesorhizobium sp. NZP2234]|uniref:DUF1365 domain-containing protein n=1 Tax=Mesorhizobium sp. NZP2234 TaxID=2483402 RepID=UPI001556408D|nr:DUF1365 domain-containing protein [Mesorhizobium sp. NZP2234]QKC88832.1 DUF1365 domain-containing protein [Mesorhizobium sp. NZP2234]
MGERITTLEQNGPPPQAAGVLYPGEVMHARLKPFGHRFVYRVFSLLVDIDRLAELGRMTWLLRVNRPGLASFHESDHVNTPGETLRAFVDGLLVDAGLGKPAARVLLLAYPRIFGYVFNPISVYFCYDAAGALIALIYAVRNTFGGRRIYVSPIRPGELGPAGVRQTQAKLFHVSPFIGMDARYHFRILPPGKTVRLRIHETENGEPLLAAAFAGTARPLATPDIGACLAKFPLMTLKIILGIHWEALKLWLKGARFHPSPETPEVAQSAQYSIPIGPEPHVPRK